MLKIAALATVSVPLLAIGALAGSSWLVVDVRPEEGPRIVVPAPLFVARCALAFAPPEVRSIEIPDVKEYSELAEEVLADLHEAPDGLLVEINDSKAQVQIEKRGAELLVEIESDDEDVSMHLPIQLAIEILEGMEGERVELRNVLASISRAPHTELLHLLTDEEEVKVWIW
jgi:hypothetical protein